MTLSDFLTLPQEAAVAVECSKGGPDGIVVVGSNASLQAVQVSDVTTFN